MIKKCKRGHAMTKANTYVYKTRTPMCMECRREALRQFKKRKKIKLRAALEKVQRLAESKLVRGHA